MAGRAATAVKSKSKPKIRSASKTSAQVKAKSPKATTAVADAAEVGTTIKAPRSRRKPKAETRTRIYWAVFNQSLKRVAVFEFDQKGEAEKRAAKLSANTGDHHFIQKIKAIVHV